MDEATARKIVKLLEQQNKKLDEVLTYLDHMDSNITDIFMSMD